jgi:NADH-quinone oxidoreductase subunit L
MAVALIVLAIGSVAAGFVGVPHALGGHNRIEAFLEPAFEAHAVAPITEFQVVEPGQTPAPAGAAGAHGETSGASAPSENAETELMLMGLSSGIALAGIGLAWYFWVRNRKAAATIARSATPIYTLLLNKYYVDQIYDAVIVQPIKRVSTFVLWRAADAVLIDGTVNGVGSAVRAASASLRRLQSGSIRAYSASLFLGVIVILGWYLLR